MLNVTLLLIPTATPGPSAPPSHLCSPSPTFSVELPNLPLLESLRSPTRLPKIRRKRSPADNSTSPSPNPQRKRPRPSVQPSFPDVSLMTETPEDSWRGATPRKTSLVHRASPPPSRTPGTSIAPRSVLDEDRSSPLVVAAAYGVAALLLLAALRLFLKGMTPKIEIPEDNRLFGDENGDSLEDGISVRLDAPGRLPL
jgi:hypothetical protein